jgi:glucose/arabinose dehydrogenase
MAMSSTHAFLGAATVLGAALAISTAAPTILASQAPQGQTPPAAGPAAPGGQPGAPGRGRGGRGNPTAALYTANCSGCHGTDLNGGRAPSLFDETWAHGSDDETIAAHIKNGIPDTEMAAFGSVLSDEQIWSMVAYLKTQGANLKGKPTYVPDPDGQVIKTEKQAFKIEVVARNLETPWGLAFLPDGRLLVTERPGHLRVVDKSGKLSDPVSGTPTVWERQDGGMFDVEVHPNYAQNGWIYLSFSMPGANNTAPPSAKEAAAQAAASGQPAGRGGFGGDPSNVSMTAVVRGRINAQNQWVDQQFIYNPDPKLFTPANVHFGSRFTFDKEGHLYYSIGERGQMANAQDLTNPLGKIHRVNDDGSVPKDNPFAGREGADPTIWTYGHRNPQGLAWDPVTGKLWESEHGPTGGDEINILEKGHNYGWGVISMGIQPGISKRSEPGMEQPVVYYTPTLAPSGIAFYAGDKYPQWKNNLFVSALAGQQLRRLEVSGDKVTAQEVLFNQFGRVHDVVVGPDGLLYVTLQLPGQRLSDSTTGMVARLVPVSQ